MPQLPKPCWVSREKESLRHLQEGTTCEYEAQMSENEGLLKMRIRKKMLEGGNYEGTDTSVADLFETLDEATKEIMQKWETAPFNEGEFFVAGSIRKFQLEKWRDEFHEELKMWFGEAEQK